MARKQRKVIVRGELREEVDADQLAVTFLVLAKSLREMQAAGIIDDDGDGEEVA